MVINKKTVGSSGIVSSRDWTEYSNTEFTKPKLTSKKKMSIEQKKSKAKKAGRQQTKPILRVE